MQSTELQRMTRRLGDIAASLRHPQWLEGAERCATVNAARLRNWGYESISAKAASGDLDGAASDVDALIVELEDAAVHGTRKPTAR